MTRIYYYISPTKQQPVADFINTLTKNDKQRLFRVFEYFKIYGITTVIPHIKKLTGTKLWEIKIVGSNSIRIIYAVILRGDVLILTGFIKKSQKIPKKYLNTALLRLKDWETRNIDIDK